MAVIPTTSNQYTSTSYLDKLPTAGPQKHELVHDDLSKYNNTLYYEGQLYIINVSQSADLDHALVIDFLHKVSTHGVDAMTVEELLNFIEDVSIGADSVENYLEEKQQTMSMVYLDILEENISEKHIKRIRNLKSEPSWLHPLVSRLCYLI
ncbi:hypothetical protein KIW84_021467 [Lathyrus oleraceus]|uniref:non-specific serine/threonine protein kinase n=1 Tax=Pisum sativum TaxID=3888 RepID=A0A9D4Y7X3_PEA|nr:hypothetical protein KIW84_021467 [Pisum sativum]